MELMELRYKTTSSRWKMLKDADKMKKLHLLRLTVSKLIGFRRRKPYKIRLFYGTRWCMMWLGSFMGAIFDYSPVDLRNSKEKVFKSSKKEESYHKSGTYETEVLYLIFNISLFAISYTLFVYHTNNICLL